MHIGGRKYPHLLSSIALAAASLLSIFSPIGASAISKAPPIRLAPFCSSNTWYDLLPNGNGSVWRSSVSMSLLSLMKPYFASGKRVADEEIFDVVSDNFSKPVDTRIPALQTLIDGRADIAPELYYMTYERSKLVDFSAVLDYSNTKIIQKKSFRWALISIE